MRRATIAVLLALAGAAGAEEKFPPELVRFAPHGHNPVFTAAGEGHWDVRIRERGWILREGDGYRMWYTGYDGTRAGKKMLGLATSPDGIRWKRHPDGPLHAEHWVEDVMVLKHQGRYLMFAEGLQDQAHLLTSPDGVKWQRVGALDVLLKNGKPIPEGPYGTPTAFLEKGTWYLFYERSDTGVWLATSTDLKVWTNVQDEPVLKPGPAEHERDLVALNQVIRHGDRYYAYYHGSAKSGPAKGLWSTCVATSKDLIHWEKYAGNPLVPMKDNRSSGILVHDGEKYRLYTMHDRVDVYFSEGK